MTSINWIARRLILLPFLSSSLVAQAIGQEPPANQTVGHPKPPAAIETRKSEPPDAENVLTIALERARAEKKRVLIHLGAPS